MFARVSTFEGSPESVDARLRVAEEQALPSMKGLDGFKGLLVLVDRGSGKSIAVTLWESEAALKASEDAANTIRSDAANATGDRIASVERYEVAVDASV